MRFLCICFVLLGCGHTGANHIGNPITLPISGLRTSIQNGVYNHKRRKVKAFVKTHFLEIKHNVLNGGGPHLSQVMDIAQIPSQKRSQLFKELKINQDLYFTTDKEPLVVALMVHGN